MKKLLLLALIGSAINAHSQSWIQAHSHYYFDELDVVTYSDSVAYNYFPDIGGIFHNEPVFGVTEQSEFAFWEYNELVPNFMTAEEWVGPSWSMTHTRSRTLNNDLLPVLEDAGQDSRILFTYDMDGNIASYTDEWFDGNDWVAYSGEEYERTNNQISVKRRFGFDGANYYVSSVDSFWYDADGLLELTVNWESEDGITFTQFSRSEFNNSNGKHDSVQHYEDDDGDAGTPIVYLFYGEYIYDVDEIQSFDVYLVIAGFPDMSEPIIVFSHNYNNEGQLTSNQITGFFGDSREVFAYNNDNLLTTITRYQKDGADQWYVSELETYYYDQALATSELSSIEMNIYPNPVVSELTIETDASIKSLVVLNANGQVVMQQSGSTTIDVSKLTSGMYQLVVQTEKGISTKAFQK